MGRRACRKSTRTPPASMWQPQTLRLSHYGVEMKDFLSIFGLLKA
jgi:hypothetical protein